MLAGVAIAGHIGADPAERQAPRSDQGRIEGSGKFTPAFFGRDPKSVPALPKDLEEFAKSLVKPIGGGRLALGRVTLDPKSRTVSVPAQVVMTEGLVEYALVTTGGKVHESLLSTDASPVHVHLAMLLMNMGPKDRAAGPALIQVEMEWRGNGPVQRIALEDLIVRGKDSEEGRRGSTLNTQIWQYDGSTVLNGRLTSEIEGSIISLIMDPAALVNAPRKLPVDDRLLLANTPKLPAVGMPVTLHFRSAPKAQTNATPAVPKKPAQN